jgi:1-acyl-sn-glycerol-3-phosphate acyltransferase
MNSFQFCFIPRDTSDASRPSVDKALSDGQRIGLAPGGIAEMMQDSSKDKEYAIVRKGIFRMAAKHDVPIIPIYCFGSSLLLRRLKLPAFIEKLGLLLRVSLVMFFGQWGLPIPFRQRLMYVVGNPIHPSTSTTSSTTSIVSEDDIDSMYRQYCNELVRIFDKHKESYAAGWIDKKLMILTEN